MTAAMIPVPVPMTRLTPDLTPGACPHDYRDLSSSVEPVKIYGCPVSISEKSETLQTENSLSMTFSSILETYLSFRC